MGMIDKNILIEESDFEIEDLSLTTKIDLKLFETLYSPFRRSIWKKLNRPITRYEIKKAIENNKLISPEEAKKKDNHSHSRSEHIQRIAWLVVNYDENYAPIQIDFGIPSFSVFTTCEDGNHRLAAAIFLKKDWILADPCGSVDLIEQYTFKI